MDGRYSAISQPIHSIVVRDGRTNTYVQPHVLTVKSGVDNYPATSYPTGVNLVLAHTGIDSEGNTPPTYTVGGLYGVLVTGITNATSGITTGEVTTLPLSSPTFYSSIAVGDFGSSYAYIWIGYFKPPTAGTYTVYTASDDGSAVWFGDAALSGSTTSNATLNNNYGGGQGTTERSATIALEADVYYPIRIVTLEGGGGAACTYSWAGPGISKTTDLSQYYYYFDDGTNFTAGAGGNTIGYVDKSVDNLMSVPSTSSGTNVYTYKKIYTVNSVIQPKNTIVDVEAGTGTGSSERWTAWV